MFETTLTGGFEEASPAQPGDAGGDGLMLLHALALFQHGDAERGMHCLRRLRESGSLAGLVDRLCPDFPQQQDRRAWNIRRSILNPAGSQAAPNQNSAGELASPPVPRVPGPAGIQELTPRQRLVLCLVRDGLTNSQIAARLLISTNTVKWHLKTISRLLGAANRCSVLRIAESRGLL